MKKNTKLSKKIQIIKNDKSLKFKDLVSKGKLGDKTSLALLCTMFRPLILKLTYSPRYKLIKYDVESIATETIIRCAKNYKSNSFNNFPGYIKLAITRDLAHAVAKKIKILQKEVTTIEDTPERFLDNGLDKEMDAEIIALHLALKELPLHYQKLLRKIYWQQATSQSLATELNISKQAANQMKKRALALLKEKLTNC